MNRDDETHRLSIILRTHNESRSLPSTLQAIRRQHASNHIELVIIDSGSTDGTQEIARKEADIFLTLKPRDFTFGRALNDAARHATGDILVILSAHARPGRSDWLNHLTGPFVEARVGGVYGKQTPYPNAWPPVIIDYTRCYGTQVVIHKSVEGMFFSAANAALRRDVWERVPFDDRMPACEDQLWARQIAHLGYWIAYEPQAEVYHSHNEGLHKVYRRRAREELGWRQILPDRKGSLRRFLDDWYTSTRLDAMYVLKNKRAWPWVLRSPWYRLFWSIGQWHPEYALRDTPEKMT